MKTLKLTSPMMTGSDVNTCQKTLGKNQYGDFYDDVIDGEFGPYSQSCTKDAQYWLGYKDENISGCYGQSLHDLLTGKAKLSKEQADRRAERKKKPSGSAIAQAALKAAIGKIGVTESPANSNQCEFTRWYGMTGPWCAMFVTWAYVVGGKSTAFVKGSRYAYCPYVVNDARASKNGLKVRTGQPLPGDIVLFDWGKDGTADHIGLFEKGSRSSFTAIEGNTSYGNNSNGGQVMRRERSGGDVILFAYAVR